MSDLTPFSFPNYGYNSFLIHLKEHLTPTFGWCLSLFNMGEWWNTHFTLACCEWVNLSVVEQFWLGSNWFLCNSGHNTHASLMVQFIFFASLFIADLIFVLIVQFTSSLIYLSILMKLPCCHLVE